MDMDKYFKELEEKQKKEEQNIAFTLPTHCPMCDRRCELISPICNRGFMFAKQNGINTKKL